MRKRLKFNALDVPGRAGPWGSRSECSFSPACSAVFLSQESLAVFAPFFFLCVFCWPVLLSTVYVLGVCPGEVVCSGGSGLCLCGAQITHAVPQAALVVYTWECLPDLWTWVGSGFETRA